MSRKSYIWPLARSFEEVGTASFAFDAASAREIIDYVGVPLGSTVLEFAPDDVKDPGAELLAQNLNHLFFEYRWDQRDQSRPGSRRLEQQFHQISKSARALLSDCGWQDGEIAEPLGVGGLWSHAHIAGAPDGLSKINQILKDVEELAKISEAAADKQRAEIDGMSDKVSGGRGRPQDKAQHQFIASLAGIYRLFWNRLPGLSRDPSTAMLSGPFFRFARCVFDVADEDMTDESLAHLIRKAGLHN